MTAPLSRDKLVAMLTTLRPTLQVLGKSFKASRRTASETASVRLFIDEGRSPAVRVIREFCSYLRDRESQHWAPFPAGRPWGEELYILAATPMWVEVGQLFQRLVRPFRCWPWRLAEVTNTELAQREKEELATELFECCQHTDPFTAEFRKTLAKPADLLSSAAITFLDDLFNNTPVSNIISEATLT